jgi:hypothetical protein
MRNMEETTPLTRILESLGGFGDMAWQNDVRSVERARSVAISWRVLFMVNEVTDEMGSSFITEAIVISRSTVESSGNKLAGPSAGSK